MYSVKKNIEYILKHNYRILFLYRLLMSRLFKFIGLFVKTDDRMILFSGLNRQYNDSPRAIFEYMINKKEYENFKFVWALDDPEKIQIPKSIKIKTDTWSYFLTALKSKYWVTCVNIERGLSFKKKNTIYLNTWHGTPFKLIGNAVKGRNDFDFTNTDLLCYAGEYEREIYKKDFKAPDSSLLLSGLPRNDELYNVTVEKIEYYRGLLSLPKDKRIILYAPTWRDSKNQGMSYSINPPIDIDLWREELQDEYILLFRAHAYTEKLLGIGFDEFIRDLSSYPEVNHLLIASDILISDYSAIIFDYSILERPILCFGYDHDQFAGERGFYLNLEEELPNGVIKSQHELITKIKTLNYKIESQKTARFKSKYLEAGGHATEKCLEKLLKR